MDDKYAEFRNSNGYIVLKRRYSELFSKYQYTCPLTIIQNRIIEYDIRAANISALRSSGRIKQETLDKLTMLDKTSREITVGKMIREDPEIGKIIKRGIKRAREMLFESNNIQDSEVLSIKNDAVFIIGRRLKHTKFGYYEFVPKNTYSMYMNIDKVELYYDRKRDTVDIKGIRDEVVEEQDHQNGMIVFLSTVFKMLIQGRKQDLRSYIIQFTEDYKSKKLPVQYYRELNSFNVYRTIIEIAEYEYNLISVGEDDKDIINGIYNYTRFVLPLVQAYI